MTWHNECLRHPRGRELGNAAIGRPERPFPSKVGDPSGAKTVEIRAARITTLRKILEQEEKAAIAKSPDRPHVLIGDTRPSNHSLDREHGGDWELHHLEHELEHTEKERHGQEPTTPSTDATALDVLMAAIHACYHCAHACTVCSTEGAEQSRERGQVTVWLNENCADVCQATARLLSRMPIAETARVLNQIDRCIDICEECAINCQTRSELESEQLCLQDTRHAVHSLRLLRSIWAQYEQVMKPFERAVVPS